MKMAVEAGRKARPGLKIGICGEHGGHPASIRLCHQVGLDYVSCSGPRVPIARLAAAHATMLEKKLRRLERRSLRSAKNIPVLGLKWRALSVPILA